MEEDLETYEISYLVYQLEMGEQGTVHLQGFIQCKRAVRFSHFHPMLEGAHFEPANGTPEQCRAYCTKEDTRLEGPWEFGVMNGQGKRNDIVSLRDAIKSGKRGRDLFDDDALVGPSVRYCRGVDRMVEVYSPPVRRESVTVTFHFGPAGTGKSHCCQSDDAYYFDGAAGSFWIGYSGQKKVLT